MLLFTHPPSCIGKAKALARALLLCRNGETASIRHRLHRVDDKVEQDLGQSIGIDLNGGQLGGTIQFDLNPGPLQIMARDTKSMLNKGLQLGGSVG
nr:hypothetical protein [uncultured Desulfobulbus sp.]